MAIKYVHRQADVSANAFPNRSQQAGLMVDSDDNKLKLNSDGTVDEIVDVRHNFTLTGAITMTGAVRQPAVNLAAASQTLTAAQSGQTFVGVVDAAFTLPAAATVGAGVHYYIVTGVASAGTGLTVVANAADDIFAAGVDTAAGGTITNSGASDVIGDNLHLVSDGVSRWVGVSARGTWA